MQPLELTVPRTARYYVLGEAGPAARQLWFCLPAHLQPAAELARQLAPLATDGRLLVVAEGLARHALPPPAHADLTGDVSALAPQTGACWFAPDSLLPDLADLTGYLDLLAAEVRAHGPAPAPLVVLGYGEGAAAACRWLAGGRQAYSCLVLYDAVFPADMDRRAAFVGLPERPVLVFQAAGVAAAETAAAGIAADDLLQDLADVGLRAELHPVAAGEPAAATLAAVLAAADSASAPAA